jgi:Tfp pilus assembly protein PilO
VTKPARRNSLIVTIPLVAVATAWVVLVFLPIQKAIGRYQAEIEQMQQYCERASRSFPVLRQTARLLADTRAKIAYWEKAAPSDSDLSELLGKITSAARLAGLRTTRFDPQQIVAHERIAEIPLQMAVSGPFPQIFAFLGSLEAMPQTAWLQRLEIEKAERNSEAVTCEINLVVFTDNPENSNQVEQSGNR